MISRFFTEYYRMWLLALLFILSLLFSLAGSPRVSAASEYDDLLTMSTNTSIGLGCAEQYGGNYTTLMSQYTVQETKESFFNAQQNGGTIAVSSVVMDPAGTRRIVIAWTQTANAMLEWRTTPQEQKVLSLPDAQAVIFRDKLEGQPNANCEVGFETYETESYYNSQLTIANDADASQYQSHFQLYYTNAEPNYPVGYEGTRIKATPNERKLVAPDYKYEVRDKHLSAKDYNQDLPTITSDEGYYVVAGQLEWTLFKCDAWDETTNNCTTSTIAKHEILDLDSEFQHDVSSYGDYILNAQYLVQQCFRYPSYPATPDYCFYVDYGVELDGDYTFLPTRSHLIIDGKDITGDTTNEVCDASGLCVPASLYDDCSTFGVDILGGVGCIIKNFGTFLKEMLTNLFVPPSGLMTTMMRNMQDFFSEKLGFLYQSIEKVIGVFTTIIGAAGTPNPVLSPQGNYFGRPVHFDMSSMQGIVSPEGWTAILTIIRSVTSVAILYGLYRTWVGMMSEGKE